MLRVGWSSSIVALLVAAAVIGLPARRDIASAADQPTQSAAAQGHAAASADNPRPAEKAGSATAAPDPMSLQTIGALSAAHYFQTYLNIGFIADGRGKATYTDEDSRKVLRCVLSLVDSVDRQLETFGKRALDKDDRDSLNQMRAISALLRRQGRELQAYWDSGKDQDSARYENLRKTSYAAINKLMAISP
jgi:hypothetical protein